jgi:sugar lactone lactonase YvrE
MKDRAFRLYPAVIFFALSLLLLCPATEAAQTNEDYTFITLAGPAEAGPGSRDGTNRFARFNFPGGIARDHNGNIFIADIGNNTIRRITPDGTVTTFAGLAGTCSTNDGAANGARFNSPNGLSVESTGIVYVADTSNHTIRKITPDGTVSTVAGLAGVPGTKNGVGTAARFNTPVGLTTDDAGNIYVADTGNNAIREIAPDGTVTTLAGSPGHSGTVDSKRSVLGLGGRFNSPFSLTLDTSGSIFVADTGNNTIRKINLVGVVTTLAGVAGNQGSDDGTNRTASFSGPQGITLDSSGNLLVADAGNNLIRKITPAGGVTTIAGLAGTTGSTDGTHSVASFNSPGDLAVDDRAISTLPTHKITPSGRSTLIET